jgi:hypothetical protein
MMIWVLGGALVLLAAVIGYFFGAIRSAVCLIGAIVAAAFAGMVGGWLGGVIPMIGYTNPIWQFYLPPLVGFVVVSILFSVVAFVVHHLVQRHYKNNTDDYTFARWERLNRRSGIALGGVLGTVWLVLIGIVSYVPGYLTTQLADENEASTGLKLINSLAHGAESTGLSRIVEHYQPASDDHYLASDILGLVYNNPALHSRLASYPPFLGLAEKPEIAELAKDPEVNSLIQSRAGVSQILEHARIRAVADNPELVNELLALDFRDLEAYLRTGVSQKYKDEHILGRWRLNVRRSVAEMKIVGTAKLPAVEFNLLRKALNVYLEEMTIGFTTDNKAILKVKAKDEQKLLQTVGRASAAPAPAQTGGGDDGSGGGGGGLTARSIAARAIPQQPAADSSADLLRSRYGLTGGAGGAQRGQPLAAPLANTSGVIPRAPAKAPTTTALGPLMSNGEGGWAKSGETYRVTFGGEGKELALDVQVKENQMVARLDGRILVFDRI